MDWKALRDELATSSYLDPSDDLTTQRGIVATSIAILDRMSNELREVSWRPVRLLKPASAPVVLAPYQGSGKPGNAPVRLVTTPRKPAPGGIAVRPIDAFAIGG